MSKKLMKNYTPSNKDTKINTNKRNLLRYERKFILDDISINTLSDLMGYIPINFYEKYSERLINSIYYDNDQYQLACESINGNYKKRKIRIRYYGPTDILELPKLEIKTKYGVVGKKDILNINKNELLKNNFSLNHIEIFQNKYNKNNFFENLKAKLLVSYKRKYFISSCNRFRFTLDNEINFKIFDDFNIKESLLNKRTYKFNKNILELKYSVKDESYASNICQKLQLRLTSFSKYVIGLKIFGLIS